MNEGKNIAIISFGTLSKINPDGVKGKHENAIR